MRLEIKVIPKASRNLIKSDGARFKAYVTAPPENNKANKALVALIASHFNVKKSAIRIVRGEHSALKIVDVSVC